MKETKQKKLHWVIFLATSIKNNKAYEINFAKQKKEIIEKAAEVGISILVEDVTTLCIATGINRDTAPKHEIIRLCVRFLASSIISFFVVGEKKITQGIQKEIDLCYDVGVPVIYIDNFIKNILGGGDFDKK